MFLLVFRFFGLGPALVLAMFVYLIGVGLSHHLALVFATLVRELASLLCEEQLARVKALLLINFTSVVSLGSLID